MAKLTPAGSALAYSTFLGGSSEDDGDAIAVDAAGAAYVTGYTYSANFPTASPLQASRAGDRDVFVTKLTPAGSALAYSTFLGGSSEDDGDAIAVDAAGAAYVAGRTYSANFPTAGALQASFTGNQDAFVAELTAAGSALAYSTYLGGSSDEQANGIAVDSAGAAYVTGSTNSTNFPTAGALQGGFAGSQDAFVAKLTAAGSALVRGLGGPAAARRRRLGHHQRRADPERGGSQPGCRLSRRRAVRRSGRGGTARGRPAPSSCGPRRSGRNRVARGGRTRHGPTARPTARPDALAAGHPAGARRVGGAGHRGGAGRRRRDARPARAAHLGRPRSRGQVRHTTCATGRCATTRTSARSPSSS